ncbi:ribonuclease H-like protein [Glonium stellatum]|uniref:Ribonuclease H-like protein n=1 Tax=Glonium stellatum TaxID=574774 RepID=A0A8E2JYW9_9PEZI|nr:ribonuclease H-like protein [Glonium stellatum]
MAWKNLTVADLKTLLARIGSPTSGSKPVLAARLTQDLRVPRLPLSSKCATSRAKTGNTQREDRKEGVRILSIDMGVKNLAFCIADASIDSSFRQPGRSAPDSEAREAQAKVHTIAWHRIDVMHEVAEANARHQIPIGDHSGAQDRLRAEPSLEDPFHPRILARTAYSLLTRILLPYRPDIVLIERQRYRSGGAAAIQEWTVRVNMLESMLWAVLETLKGEKLNPRSPRNAENVDVLQVFDVSPARVGAFWIDSTDKKSDSRQSAASIQAFELGPEGEISEKAGESVIATRKISAAKVRKRDKIQLVRSWLSDAPYSSKFTKSGNGKEQVHGSYAPITFSFAPEADKTREALCIKRSGTKRSRVVSEDIQKARDVSKLDDLADCFLQAAAWVAWEWNRLEIQREGVENILCRPDFDEDKPMATKRKMKQKMHKDAMLKSNMKKDKAK